MLRLATRMVFGIGTCLWLAGCVSISIHRSPVKSAVEPQSSEEPSVNVRAEVDSKWVTHIPSDVGAVKAEASDLARLNRQPGASDDAPVKVAALQISAGLRVPPAPGAGDYDGAAIDRSTDEGHDINLTTAMALVAGQNPQVAYAHERIHEAFARWDAAKVLWLPSIQAGMSFNRHDGTLQDSRGRILDVNRSSLQTGFGVNAVGAGTQATPGLLAEFHLSDAIFQPRIAERTVTARQYAATAVNNDQLLAAALAYLDLLQATEQQVIAHETLRNTQQLADLTATFARTGQGAQADADRLQAELAIRKNEVARALEAVKVASARLAEVLSLDPSLPLHVQESTVVPIQLVSLDVPVQELVAAALANRPELSESQMLISQAVQRLRREKYAPLIPSILLGLSYGGFGGGAGDTINSYHDRFDVDLAAYWELRNLGFGEKSARAETRSRVNQAKYQQVQLMDRVAREVVEAHAQIHSREEQIETAKAGIEAASDSYNRNRERIRNGQGLPIEVLQSVQALDQAHREYLRVVIDYDEAQFRLHRALGWPSDELAYSPSKTNN